MKIPQLHLIHNTKATSIIPKSRESYGRIWEAYIEVNDLLLVLVKQGSSDPEQISESQSCRVALTASLLQSSAIIEELISAGYYSCASATLRHNMEVLARTIHTRKGKAVDDHRPPNVGVLPFELSKNYGRLSEICHVAKGEVHGDFISTEDELVASPEVRYNTSYSIILFAIHIGILLGLAWEMHHLQCELFSDKLKFDILKSTGIISQILVDENLWYKKDLTDLKEC